MRSQNSSRAFGSDNELYIYKTINGQYWKKGQGIEFKVQGRPGRGCKTFANANIANPPIIYSDWEHRAGRSQFFNKIIRIKA